MSSSKACTKCGIVKDLDEYNRHVATRDGRQGHCRDCQRQISAAWTRANPEKKRAASRRQILRRYGLTLADYDQMLAAQGGGCWVCGAEPGSHRNYGHASLAVDHDHETGAVRGLLCHTCNRALGLIEGHTDRMAEYVTKEKEGER